MRGLDKAGLESGLVAIAATTVAATATAATMTTTATTISATATTATFTARRAFFARTRNINAQVATLQILVVEHVNPLLGFFRGAHFNKGKAAGSAGEFIEHQLAFDDGTGLLEQVFEVAFGGTIGQISYVQSCFHSYLSLCHSALRIRPDSFGLSNIP
jgi:hypothetical protein